MREVVLVHAGLTVSDIVRSERFYTAVFGFTRDRDLRMPGKQLDALMQLKPTSDIHSVFLRLGFLTLELMEFDPPSAAAAGKRHFNQTGLAHLSFAVEDVATAIGYVLASGGTLCSQAGRAAIIRDPDGQLIELLEYIVNDEIEKARAERRIARG